MADRKSSGIESIISSDSINLQKVPARVVIGIGVVVLDKPLGIQRFSSTGIEVVLPTMFGYHKKSAIHPGDHVKSLAISGTHGSQPVGTGDRIGRIIAPKIFPEQDCSPRTNVIRNLVRPRVSERSTPSLYLLKINGFAGDITIRVVHIFRLDDRYTIPPFFEVCRTLGIGSPGSKKGSPSDTILRIVVYIPATRTDRTVIRKNREQGQVRISSTYRICRRAQNNSGLCLQTSAGERQNHEK